MEFTNEISFDKKLTENEKSKITYNGFLAKKGSNNLTIVYGFGSNWDYTQSKDMAKINNGFETEIEMKSYDTFNFCFRNENYEWDNNNTFNYISPIEKQIPVANSSSIIDKNNSTQNVEDNKSLIENKKEIEKANIQLTQMENEIANLFDELFSMPDKSYENIVEPISEPTPSISSAEFNLDELIEEILSPIISQDNSDTLLNSIVSNIATTDSTSPLVEEKVESNFSDIPTHTQKILVEDILENTYSNINNFNSNKVELAKVDKLLETLSDKSEQFASNVVENSKFENFESIEDIDKLFGIDNFVQKAEVEIPSQKISDFTILEDEEPQEPSLLEEAIKEKNSSKVEENVALAVVKDEEKGISVSPRKLTKFYLFKKKVKLAFYKALVSIPKFLQKQFNSSENN